jgi:hypothetical protein
MDATLIILRGISLAVLYSLRKRLTLSFRVGFASQADGWSVSIQQQASLPIGTIFTPQLPTRNLIAIQEHLIFFFTIHLNYYLPFKKMKLKTKLLEWN